MSKPFNYIVLERVSKSLPQPFNTEELALGIMKADPELTDFTYTRKLSSAWCANQVRQHRLFPTDQKNSKRQKYSYDKSDAFKGENKPAWSPTPTPQVFNGMLKLEIPVGTRYMEVAAGGYVYTIKRIKE